MRFMKIEAKVRLKNFEHIVDLIEQDGGTVNAAKYTGNGAAPVKRKAGSPSTANKLNKPIYRPRLTREKVQAVKIALEVSPNMSKAAMCKRFGISDTTLTRIKAGERDYLLKS